MEIGGKGLSVQKRRPSVAEKPVNGTVKAKEWNEVVEEAYRLQISGWANLDDYVVNRGEPDRWPDSGYIKKLQVKKTGYWHYFKKGRECDDKDLFRIRVPISAQGPC